MIVNMKKAKVFVLKEHEKALLTSLQRYGVLMITNELKESVDTQYEEDILTRTNKIIKDLEKYSEKKKFYQVEREIVSYDRFSHVEKEAIDFLEEVEEKLSNLSKLNETIKTEEEKTKELEVLKDLEVSPKALQNLTYANAYIGYVNKELAEDFELRAKESGFVLNKYGENANGVYYVLLSLADKLDTALSLGLQLIELEPYDNLIKEEIENSISEVETCKEKIKELEEELKKDAKNVRELKILSDQMLSQKSLKQHHPGETEETIYFEGWVREDEVEKLTQAVEDVTKNYELEIRDPNPEEVPPTKHKNNAFVRQFEEITNMFAVPKYDEMDPNPIMSIWYWLFFGMMIGDLGYGIVIALIFGIWLLIKRPKKDESKIIKILFLSSIPSMFFGLMYGSVFGVSIKAKYFVGMFDPINDPIPMLIASLGVGIVHIIIALIIKAVKLFKEKDYLGIFAESISWILIIPGLTLLIVSMAGVLGNAAKITGIVLAAVGALMIIAFGGRHRKSIFGKIFGGVGGLYNVTSYLSDILSYTRILALALSSAVIAFAMNIIAGMLQASVIGFIFSILVYIVGHVFNLAMGMLSAYVHDSRLQYIEFFGKFYEGGGYLFKPLKLEYKHITNIEDNIVIEGDENDIGGNRK